ncbi:MAG TPA: efflux RND transporter periplasmic adaptor subunit [Thermomicrobiales bacterium]|nr:efflux RND transporter periplasmic adaptor subunit [Thermomicrobiales bacterium]
MNRQRGAIAALAVALVSVIAIVILWDRTDAIDTAVVTRGSIDVTIQTVGTIQAPDADVVRGRVGGTIQAIGARLGDEVASGDILLILDQEPFDRAVTEAENQLEQAEFALQLAERRASEAPDDDGRRFDVLAAADRVARAERAVADAQAQRRQSVIVAPAPGTIIELTPRQGDTVGANQTVARIALPEDLRLIADVDELDLPNVEPGASARFRLDAYPAVELEGEVRTTAPVARQQGGATVFATTIQFESQPTIDIRPGMNADVTIVTDARENVLLIPESALRTVGARSFVIVVSRDDTTEREVTLGYRGQGLVEIVSGISEGERVQLR